MIRNRTSMILILSLMLLAIIGLSAVSATDAVDNSTTDNTDAVNIHNSYDNSQVTSDNYKNIGENNKKTLKGDEADSFTNLEAELTDKQEVILNNDYIKADDETAITINNDIIIDGNGHTISSSNGTFDITNKASVTLKNIILTGNNGTNSLIVTNGNLTCINVTFTDNNIITTGTMVEIKTNANLSLINCTTKNQCSTAAFDLNSNSNIIVSDSVFDNIYSLGGAIRLRNRNINATITNSNFTNNHGSNYGGALYCNNINQKIIVDNCYFENNSATTRGGAIRTNGNLTLTNSIFVNNNLTTETTMYAKKGGALWLSSGNAYLQNNTMNDCEGLSAEIYNDGATILSPINMVISNVTTQEDMEYNITVNMTDDNGNSIDLYSVTISIYDMEDNLIETHTLEHNNSNIINGTAIFNLVAEIEMGNYIIFLANDEEEVLNPIVSDANLVVTKSPYLKYRQIQQMIDDAQENDVITLESDIRRGNSEDSVILNKSITLDVNNHVWNAKGERIFDVTEGAIATVKNMETINVGNTYPLYTNTQGRFANITNGSLTLENVHIINSTAPVFGSNMVGTFLNVSRNSNLNLNNCTIEDSQATVILSEGTVYINNTIIKNIYNPGTDYQGLIENLGKLDINNSQIINNTANLATIYGMRQSQPMTVDNTSFINNTAFHGSGMAIRTNDKTNITNSIFINNTGAAMSSKGGAIYSNDDLYVYNSTFINNYANGNNGSIIYISNGNLNISHSILVALNASTVKAIYNEAEGETTAVANYNWWATNTTPQSLVGSGKYYDYSSWDEEEYDCTPIEVTYWVVLNSSVNPSENINYQDTVEITTTLNQYTDGTNYYDLDVPLQDTLYVNYTSDRGNFSQDSAIITGGIAKVNYTVTSSDSTINVTSYTESNILHIQATMPTPQKVVLNDGNFTYYFNDDGTVKEDIIHPNDELQFEGEFNNRNIIITMPLNITTATTQAVFNNGTIIVKQKAGGTIISDIQFNSNDNDEYLILVDKTTNLTIENNTLAIENNIINDTHAIIVNDADDIKILNNTITTIGLSKNVNYDANTRVYTSSINAITTDNLVIDSNTITTNYTGQSDIYGTIESIDIRGNSSNKQLQQNTMITNNKIYTQADKYAYGVVFNSLVANSTIDNNTIETYSNSYANGIELFNSSYNNITNNNIKVISDEFTYAIYVSSSIDEANKIMTSDHNNILYNTLDSKSPVTYIIELYLAQYNNINYNNMTSNASRSTAIAGYGSGYSNMSYNNINIVSTMDDVQTTNYDAIDSYPNGIKWEYTSSSYSGRNNITYNNITLKTNTNNATYAVNLTSTALNNITNNYLVASTTGNESVIGDGYQNTIENNTPITDLSNILITVENITVQEGEIAQLTVNVTDTEGQPITEGNLEFRIDNLTQTMEVTNGQVLFQYNNTKGIYTVDIIYENDNHYTNITTATITIIKLKNVTIEVNDMIGYINQEITINAVFSDEDDMLIETGIVELRDANDNLLDVANITNAEVSFKLIFNKQTNTTLKLVYLQNDEYNQAQQTVTLNVIKPATTITFEQFTLIPGQKTNITAAVTDETGQAVTNGKVVFKINGKTVKDENGKVIYIKVTDGKATLEYTLPAEWADKNLTIEATYSGSSNYESSRSQKETINITKEVPAMEIISDSQITIGQTSNITVKVTLGQTPINTGKVVLKINGKTLKDENGKVIYLKVQDGQVTFDVTLTSYKPANYTFTATFIDTQYQRIEESTNITLVR